MSRANLMIEQISQNQSRTTYKKVKRKSIPKKAKEPEYNIEIPKLTKDDPCPICYSELSDEDSYAKIEDCTHLFCLECIRKWSREKNRPTCPMCNKSFTKVFEIKKSGKVVKLDAKTLVREDKSKNSQSNINEQPVSSGFGDFRDYEWEYQQRLGIYKNNMMVKKFSKRMFNRFKKPADLITSPHEVTRLAQFISRELMVTCSRENADVNGVYGYCREWLPKILMSIQKFGLPEFKKRRWTVNTELIEILEKLMAPNKKWVHIFVHEVTYFAASHCFNLEEFDNNAVYATLDDGERELEKAERNKGAIVIGTTPDLSKNSSKSKSRLGSKGSAPISIDDISKSPVTLVNKKLNPKNSRKRKEPHMDSKNKRTRQSIDNSVITIDNTQASNLSSQFQSSSNTASQQSLPLTASQTTVDNSEIIFVDSQPPNTHSQGSQSNVEQASSLTSLPPTNSQGPGLFDSIILPAHRAVSIMNESLSFLQSYISPDRSSPRSNTSSQRQNRRSIFESALLTENPSMENFIAENFSSFHSQSPVISRDSTLNDNSDVIIIDSQEVNTLPLVEEVRTSQIMEELYDAISVDDLPGREIDSVDLAHAFDETL